MTITEITWNRSRHSFQSYAHTVILTLDALNWNRFRAGFEDHDEVTILEARQDGSDRVIVQCGCQSAAAAKRLWDAWN